MPEYEVNPLSELGVDSALLKLIADTGDVEGLRAFVNNHQRTISRSLHPDVITNKTANEKFARLTTSIEAIRQSPDILLAQWVKGLRVKKTATPQPQLAKPSNTLRELIYDQQEATPFWKPARYVLEMNQPHSNYSFDFTPRGLAMGLVINDGAQLWYQELRDISTSKNFVNKTTIKDDVAMATAFPGITEFLLNEKPFHNLGIVPELGNIRSASGILDVRADGTNTLMSRDLKSRFYDVLPEELNEAGFGQPGIYMLNAISPKHVQERASKMKVNVQPGAALAASYPSVTYKRPPSEISGSLVGFMNKDYWEALAQYRQHHSSAGSHRVIGELSAGERVAYSRSIELQDQELETVEPFYRSSFHPVEKQAALLVARDGRASLFGRAVLALPFDTSKPL